MRTSGGSEVNMGASAEPGRSSASRLLAVLGAFDRRRPAMNLTQLAAVSGVSLATTHRIAKELTQWGALERNPDGTFQIGLKLWEVGSLAPRQRELRRVAQPSLNNLYEATREIVQLAVLEEGYALVVEKVSGSRAVPNVTEVAGRLPLHATGVGKVFLAFGPDELQARMRAGQLRRYTERTVTSPAVITAAIRKAQREYVTYCRDEMTIGTSSVAAPIFDNGGNLAGALGLLLDSRAPLTGLAPAVLTAAVAISRRMGYFGPIRPVEDADQPRPALGASVQ
jgi:DNA-binding IclR family transcriptional regulator